jgi:heme ABC exporter ATP-binding subunit CcmA
MGAVETQGAVFTLSGLVKRFGAVRALDGVSLELRAGELLLLLGPNGAGKTTLTRVLTTLSRPGKGGLLFRGEPLKERSRALLRREVGYLSHQSFLYAHLTAEENLRFYGRLYGVGELDRRVRESLAAVGLPDTGGRLAGTFSRGMQQRLSLARVLLTAPRLLILDEPYAGLDPAGSRILTELLRGLKTGERAILLVTHELEDCLAIADRIAVLHKGRVAWESGAAGLTLEQVRLRYFEATEGGGAP